MPTVYIIIGDKNTRKSSTIRALTGASRRRTYQVATKKEEAINIFVQISSLQESGISPQNFIKEVQKNNYQYILVSLWISAGNGQPQGSKYIQDFLKAKWDIQKIVVLGTKNKLTLPSGAPEPNYISGASTLPANQIASQIRKWWQWL